MLDNFGSPTWARTRDLRINSPSLYRLSYRGIFGTRMIMKPALLVKFPATGFRLLDDFSNAIRDVLDIPGIKRGDANSAGIDCVDGELIAQSTNDFL